MKSVGEVMAIGRTFKQALLKAVRSLETGKRVDADEIEPRILTKRLVTPHPERLQYIRYALSQGMSVREIAQMTNRSIPGSCISSKKFPMCRPSWAPSPSTPSACARSSAWASPMRAWAKR
jgi:hypothetical protein